MKKYVFFLTIFAALEISLALYLTFWREHFWNAVSQKQGQELIIQLTIFTGVALVICFVSGFSGYLVSLTSIEWRKRLNSKAFAISDSRIANGIENFNQRIQEDCMSYPDLVINLTYGLVKALMYIIVFVTSLCVSFSWLYLILLASYSIIGTFMTKRIAYPLISLNYKQQYVEATYRNNICVENFTKCVHVMLHLARKTKNLSYFQQFYGQIGIVLPIILIAPQYFSTTMTIGELMRFNSIGSTILDNMSYGITNFGLINKLLSCRTRLKEAGVL